jgi:hypothetical protein
LRVHSNGIHTYTTELSELTVDKRDGRRGDGEAQTFASAAAREDEGVDADQIPVTVNQGASAIAWIDGSVGLNVDHRAIELRLAAWRADDSHGDGVFQTFGRTDGQHRLSEAHSESFRILQRQERKIGSVNLQ